VKQNNRLLKLGWKSTYEGGEWVVMEEDNEGGRNRMDEDGGG
jgi:hypothetical protein